MKASQLRQLAIADAPVLTHQYRALSFEDTGHAWRVSMECTAQPSECPHCGSPVAPWGRQLQTFHDLPRRGRPVELAVEARRYRCKNETCRKTFTQALPAMSPRRMLTQRLSRWIGEAGVSRTFVAIAREVGLHEKTVRAVFDDYKQIMQTKVRMNAGPFMALLSAKILGSRRYLILNTGSKMITDLVEAPTAAAISQALKGLGRPHEIQYLSVEFDPIAHDAAALALPSTVVFIDPLEVGRLLNQGLSAARRALHLKLDETQQRRLRGDLKMILASVSDVDQNTSKRLQNLLSAYPVLGEAHRFKQSVLALYGTSSPVCADEAKWRIDAAIAVLSPDCLCFFAEFTRHWEQWQKQILNAFTASGTPPSVLGLTNGREMAGMLTAFGREHCFSALRTKLFCPSGIPAFSLSSPGMGVSRLRAQIEVGQRPS